jgi:hypothetical protein
MAGQPTYTPTVHGKNAKTGKGAVSKMPQSGAAGPSNHVPQVGRPSPGENYSSEQQQK